LSNLTAREHLELFGKIKGIRSEYLADMIDQKINEMGLTKYQHKAAGTYSGGNKRKLMVA
jgi:ABC-type multidrug transport system ATPase subunit